MPKYKKNIKLKDKNSDEIFVKIKQELHRFLDKTPIGPYELKSDETSKLITVESKMFSAELFCKNNEIELEVNLSLFAAPFKSKLDEGIEKWVAKVFSA